MKPNVFISHRHQDAKLAASIRQMLQTFGLSAAQISSSSGPGSVAPGAELSDHLINALRETDTFILLFTSADEDWSYCMWELGIATGLETKPTTVITLNFGGEQPAFRKANLSIDAQSLESILEFVRAVDTSAPEEALNERASRLHESFKAATPSKTDEQSHRLEHLVLRLDEGSAAEVARLRSAARDEVQDQEAYELARQEIASQLSGNIVVLDSSSRSGLRVFGLETGGVTLDAAVEIWREALIVNLFPDGMPEAEEAWLPAFLGDLSRAVVGLSSRPTQFSVRPVEQRRTRVKPVIARTTRLSTGVIEFDVYLLATDLEAFDVEKRRTAKTPIETSVEDARRLCGALLDVSSEAVNYNRSKKPNSDDGLDKWNEYNDELERIQLALVGLKAALNELPEDDPLQANEISDEAASLKSKFEAWVDENVDRIGDLGFRSIQGSVIIGLSFGLSSLTGIAPLYSLACVAGLIGGKEIAERFPYSIVKRDTDSRDDEA